MKKLLLTMCLISIFLICNAQTISKRFFVEKAEGGYEQPIINKLLSSDYKVTFKKDSSDFTILCIIGKTGWGRAKASVAIIDTKSGDIVIKSKEASGQTTAFNGYGNPQIIATKKIADKQLIDLINKIPITD